MPTRSYSYEAHRSYGEATGVRLIAALEGVGADPFTVAQAVNEGVALDLTPQHTATLLTRLAAGGWVTRVKKGVYAINDPVTKLPRAHPFAIGTALVTPSAISHWSALQHWGLTEQISATVMLSSPRRTFPSSDQAQSRRPAWIVAGVRYEVVALAKPRFFGITHVWANERNQIPIFDRERALLDAFHHFHVFGSLSVALEILEAHLGDINIPLLKHSQCRNMVRSRLAEGWQHRDSHRFRRIRKNCEGVRGSRLQEVMRSLLRGCPGCA